MLKRALHLFVMCLVCLLVLGCDSTDTTDNPPVPVTNPTPFPGNTFPLVDPANSVIPLPNDLLRNPTTGKLAFPGTGERMKESVVLESKLPVPNWHTGVAARLPVRSGVSPTL